MIQDNKRMALALSRRSRINEELIGNTAVK